MSLSGPLWAPDGPSLGLFGPSRAPNHPLFGPSGPLCAPHGPSLIPLRPSRALTLTPLGPLGSSRYLTCPLLGSLGPLRALTPTSLALTRPLLYPSSRPFRVPTRCLRRVPFPAGARPAAGPHCSRATRGDIVRHQWLHHAGQLLPEEEASTP